MEYVYAVISGNSAPGSGVTAVTADSDVNTVIPTDDGGADAATATYNETRNFDGLGQSLSTRSVQTYDSSGDGVWTTFLLNDGSDNPVYAAAANSNGDGFNGNSVDYQMLLPAGSDMGSPTYDFYVELK